MDNKTFTSGQQVLWLNSTMVHRAIVIEPHDFSTTIETTDIGGVHSSVNNRDLFAVEDRAALIERMREDAKWLLRNLSELELGPDADPGADRYLGITVWIERGGYHELSFHDEWKTAREATAETQEAR